MFTILDAVTGAWRPWAVSTQTEALKIWFYALSVSVVLDLYEILFVYSDRVVATTSAPADQMKEKKPNSEGTERGPGEIVSPEADSQPLQATKRRILYRQLVIDSCDVLIPGAAVGWLNLDPVTVGVVGTISALVSISDAWTRVNA